MTEATRTLSFGTQSRWRQLARRSSRLCAPGHSGHSYKVVIHRTKGALQPGNSRAAVGACEVGKGDGQRVKHRGTGCRYTRLRSWAFITVHHSLLSSALPPRPTGTDRGRQSANPRITGGLVSATRGNASSPARPAARMRPRAANGRQLLLLGRLARDLYVLPSHVRKLAMRRPAHRPDPSRPGVPPPRFPGPEHRRARLEPRARIEECAGRPPCLERTSRRRPGSRIGPAIRPAGTTAAPGCGWSMAASGGRRVARPRSSWSVTSSAWTATSPRSPT